MKLLALGLILFFAAGVSLFSDPDPKLLAAVVAGDLKTLQAGLKLKPDLAAADGDGNTLLHHALKNRQEETAGLLMRSGADIARRNAAGQEAIHLAAAHALPKIVAVLLAGKAKAAAVDKDGLTPLHNAAAGAFSELPPAMLEKSYLDVIKILLATKGAARADINARNTAGYTPLLWSLKHLNHQRSMYLISQGADLRARAIDGTAVIHLSAGRNMSAVVKQCLAKGVDVNLKDGRGWTALRHAAESASMETLELLASVKGIQPGPLSDFVNKPEPGGLTPLYEPLRAGSVRLTELYLKAGARLESKSDQGYTPLLFALIFAVDGEPQLRKKYLELAAFLLNKGADGLVRAKDGRNAFDIARKAGLNDIVAIIKKRGFNEADISLVNGSPVLIEAVRAGNVKETERLLAGGATVDIRDKEKKTALFMLTRPELEKTLRQVGRDKQTGAAVYEGGRQPQAGPDHYACARLLLAKGLDINAIDSNNRTALCYAVIFEDKPLAEFLLAAKADPNGGAGASPLACVGPGASLDLVKMLVQAGARPDFDGQEPPAFRLHTLKRMDLIEYLAGKGLNLARPHAGNGRTLLHLSATDNDLVSLDFFLARGVPVNHEEASGMTALDYARIAGAAQAAARLEAAGGKPGSQAKTAAPAAAPVVPAAAPAASAAPAADAPSEGGLPPQRRKRP